ncbi:unnamed protein product [Dicrocoelium dendriticum]|nr:unnamed protein product [Dicrocoelium dendriticum]
MLLLFPGDAFIEYKGTIYLSEETRNIVYKDDEGCTVKLHLRRPQPKERHNGRGYIGGSRFCENWFYSPSEVEKSNVGILSKIA